jgi:hypothetical protein
MELGLKKAEILVQSTKESFNAGGELYFFLHSGRWAGSQQAPNLNWGPPAAVSIVRVNVTTLASTRQ